MRFVSAQLESYLDNDLWLRLAAHANAMARQLAKGFAAMPDATLCVEPQANEVFVRLRTTAIARLRKGGARFYPWPMPGDDEQARTIRLVTSFQSQPSEIDAFLALAAG